MEVLRAKVQEQQVFWTFTMIIKGQGTAEMEVKQSPDPMQIHIQDGLQKWLESCQGKWEIISHVDKSPEIEFELEQDYVRYCFDWL